MSVAQATVAADLRGLRHVRYQWTMRSYFLSCCCVLALCFSATGLAQEAPSGFRGEVLKQIADAEKKTISLAQTMPQEKYSWRPAPGVRSVSEVYMHIAGANFLLPNFIGAKMPPGLDRNMEKTVTDRAKVVEMLQKSFAHIREAVMNMKDEDLNTEVKMFGNTTTKRGALLLMSDHMHEHLGQSIAYARTNGVTPPWSQGKAE